MCATDAADPARDAAGQGAIDVEVVYALPDGALLHRLSLPTGSRVTDAIEAFIATVGQLPYEDAGIFGKRCDPSTPLRDGDRVELYRLLLVDPKEVRRERARKRP